MKFFASQDHNGHFEEVFAVSEDGRAVKWNVDKPSWKPLSPSRKLAWQAAGDASLQPLDQYQLERLWTLADPPRNFSTEWRVRERWTGWVSVGLGLLPVIPLWFVWEELVRWVGGYGATVAGVVIVLQAASLLLLREPLMQRLVTLSKKLDAQREKRHSNNNKKQNPAQDARLNNLRDMPKESFHELAAMGMELAQMDAEHNLRVRTQQHRNSQIEKQSRHTITMDQKKSPALGGQWTVYVDDNFHYMDQDERYFLGSFDSYDAAATACRKVVDDCLASIPAQSADELFKSYCAFGEDPWIAEPPAISEQPRFSARDYAKRRCSEIHYRG